MAFDAETQAALDKAAATSQHVQKVVPVVPGRICHVDGDMATYYWGCINATKQEARTYTMDGIEAFRRETGSEKVVVHLTSKGSHKGERFLCSTVKPYQGQRKADRALYNKDYLQDYLEGYTGDAFKVKIWEDREADDGMAACAYYATTQGRLDGIATRDKDMRMFPGIHIDWIKRHTVEVPAGAYDVVCPVTVLQYGTKWFWQQMLQGDTADHIPGLESYRGDWDEKKGLFKIKKMGEATAEKMLHDCMDNRQAYERVAELYMNYYAHDWPAGTPAKNQDAWADRFVEQASLLWMRLDLKASVLDFLTHKGTQCISEHFHEQVVEAAHRLDRRVKAARAKINSFGN